jgi:hypothetical protein
MIGRLRDLANRPVSELPTAAVLAACVLLIALGALVFAQLDDPEPRRTPAAEPAPDSQEGYEVTHPPVVSHYPRDGKPPSEEGELEEQVTPAQAEQIRRATRRFMAGYLPYSYGNGGAGDIEGAAQALIVLLTEKPPRVPNSVRRRRPRLELVHLDGAGPTDAAAIATVDDGVTRYSVHVRLIRTSTGGWIVTEVGPA